MEEQEIIGIRWKGQSSGGDLTHYKVYKHPGSEVCALDVDILTGNPEEYYGGEVRRVFNGKSVLRQSVVFKGKTFIEIAKAVIELKEMEESK